MTFTVFLAVLMAALLHALWNGIIKLGSDKQLGMLMMSIGHGLFGLIIAITQPIPTGVVWVWLAGSAIFHFCYKVFLTSAYERGDLSRVYPIARGAAPMFVLLIGSVILPDTVLLREYLGVTCIGLGIILMARGVFSNGESRKLIPFALGSAVSTAGYSMVDGLGARAWGNATGYVAWLFLLDAVLFVLWFGAVRGLQSVPAKPQVWLMGILAGGLSLGAYWIAVWAMTVAPIALVTAIRETSVLFAVLIGIIFLKEPADVGKMIAAGVIVSGIILVRL